MEKVVYVRVNYQNVTVPSGSLNITLPAAYRPDVRIDFVDGTNNGGYLQIETSGVVTTGGIASGQKYFKVDQCYLL